MLRKPSIFRLVFLLLLLLTAFPWFWSYFVGYFNSDPIFTPFGYEKSHDLLHHYNAARHLNMEGNLHSFVYIYPPLTARFYYFIGLDSYQIAHSVWMITNIVLWAGSYLFYRYHFQPRFSLMLAILYLCFPALIHNLSIGQNSLISLWIILIVGWALKNKREWVAGFFLSCLFYKPQLLLPVTALFLFTGQFRVILASAFGSIVWLLVGILFCGLTEYFSWFRLVLSDPELTFINILQTSLYGIFQTMTSNGAPAAIKLIWLGIIIICLALFHARQKYSPLLNRAVNHERFFLMIPLTTFIPPYFGLYDWTITLPAMCLLVSWLADEPKTTVHQPLLTLLVLYLPISLYFVLFALLGLNLPLLFIVSMFWLVLLYGPWLQLNHSPPSVPENSSLKLRC